MRIKCALLGFDALQILLRELGGRGQERLLSAPIYVRGRGPAIDDAIALVSTERSKLGAVQNRFEHTISNLGVAVENLSASESRIRDTDMAAEMAQLTRHQVLTQAGTAMLAQANSSSQSVLSLLQVMEQKKLVGHKSQGKVYSYFARAQREKTFRQGTKVGLCS